MLSIKPEFAEKIFSGEKRFEFRKTCFKEDVRVVLVYVTMPVGKIVGEFKIDRIFAHDPSQLWEITKKFAGVTHDSFNEYFSGRDVGYAIKIKEARRYRVAKDPYVEEPNFIPPQSFRYLRSERYVSHQPSLALI